MHTCVQQVLIQSLHHYVTQRASRQKKRTQTFHLRFSKLGLLLPHDILLKRVCHLPEHQWLCPAVVSVHTSDIVSIEAVLKLHCGHAF